ncbi:unnamed protein product [Durusdinium trenchii]|uniref:SET domain-containing protein n=1 Tax=Durusdinium trenchii TaxID=1381693 RepID=A0ABP0N3A8_9DINO
MADLAKFALPATLSLLEAAVERLFAAAKGAGCFVSPKIKRGCVPPLNIPGLVAVEAIEEGEELIRIPSAFHITPPSVEKAAPALAEAAWLNAFTACSAACALHAFFVARLLADAQVQTRLIHRTHLDLAAFFWVGFFCVAQVWEAYADTLLTEDFSYHPFRLAACSPAEMRRDLTPSQEAEYFIDMAGETVLVRFPKFPQLMTELGKSWKSQAEMFLRARMSAQTRVFQTCVDTTLVPVADLLNHSPTLTPGVLWSWDAEAEAMIVTAVRVGSPFVLSVQFPPIVLVKNYLPPMEPGPTCCSTELMVLRFTRRRNQVLRDHQVRPIMKIFMDDEEARPLILLETSHIDDSLCQVLNKVARKGSDAIEFLRLLCARSRWSYEQDDRIRPALDALARARDADPGSHAWWKHIDETHKELVQQDSVRVIMSEYLCLTAHLEAADAADASDDAADAGSYLSSCEAWRKSLVKALRLCKTGGFSISSATPA